MSSLRSQDRFLMVIPHASYGHLDNRIHSFEQHPDVPVVKRTLALMKLFRKIIFVSGSSHKLQKPIQFNNIEYHTITGSSTLDGFLKSYDLKLMVLFVSMMLHYRHKLRVLNFSMTSSSVMLNFLSKMMKIKFTTFFTGVPEATSRYITKTLFDYKLLLFFSSKVITNNPSVKNRLLKIHSRHDMEIIPNFVQQTFRPLKLSRNLKTVLYAGRLAPEKRVSHLLEAFSQLKEWINDVTLYIAGEGPELQALCTLSENLGISKSVQFLGWVSHDDLPSLMNKCGLLVLPSLHEGFPNVLLEAMACGTPVICMDTSYSRWIVDEAGLLVDPNSVEQLAEAIKCTLLDSSLWKKLSEKGIKRTLDFKIGQFTGQIMKILD